MSSLNKNFSINKLYEDLEKYEANLTNIKDSRLKKQASASSFYQRPNSTHKNYESRESYTQQNFTKFEKGRQELLIKNKVSRPSYEKLRYEEKNSFMFDDEKEKHELKGYVSEKDSVLRDNYFENSQSRKENKQEKLCFNKSDELYFLNECNKLYKLNGKSNGLSVLTFEEEAESVRVLSNEINKRDMLFDSVSKRLGVDNIEEKLDIFLEEYERMRKIINEFKKMSKLDIDNDEELYEFLSVNQGEQKEEQGRLRKGEEKIEKRLEK